MTDVSATGKTLSNSEACILFRMFERAGNHARTFTAQNSYSSSYLTARNSPNPSGALACASVCVSMREWH